MLPHTRHVRFEFSRRLLFSSTIRSTIRYSCKSSGVEGKGRVGQKAGKGKLRYFFFFVYMKPGFIFNSDSHRLYLCSIDEFRSRNTPGLAPCGQTSKGLGTLGRRWIEARLVGCRLASARRCSSLRIAGQPTASSAIGLQPASG